MDESLARRIRQRAGHACEYCRMPEAYYPTVPFPIDHIIARQHGGTTTLGNLALSCLHEKRNALRCRQQPRKTRKTE
jgi:HNH endonuclease